MKRYILFIGIAFLSVSCIDWGLDELPLHKDAEIISFAFEYRYTVINVNGFERLEYRILTNTMTISDGQVTNVLTIPPPSGTFTAEIASQIDLDNIVGYASVSNAATIAPVDGPVLGKIGDFSQPVRYKVTAPSGANKIWTVTTTLSD